jgi:hypothetical protein
MVRAELKNILRLLINVISISARIYSEPLWSIWYECRPTASGDFCSVTTGYRLKIFELQFKGRL